MTVDNVKLISHIDGEFKALADRSPFGIFRTNAQGASVYTNHAWSRISGLGVKESLGYGWSQMIHPKDRDRVIRAWQQAVESGSEFDMRYRIIRRDGAKRYIRATAWPLPDGHKEHHGYMGIAVDITDQLLAERRLRQNNLLLTSVLENIPCGVSVFDDDGRLLLDNRLFRSLLALSDEEGDSVLTDFGTLPLEAGQTTGSMQLDVDSGPMPHLAPDDARPAREEIQPDGRVLEIRDAGMPTGGIVTTYTDVTQHKQLIDSLEQAKLTAEQAVRAKATFLATMSHEIRTPMNGVIGMTQLLLDTPLSANQRELVEVIRQSGESLLVVINDILDYTKIESGQMELEWTPLRLQDVISNSMKLLSVKAQEKNVGIIHQPGTDVPPLIYGDRIRLQQILVNLLSNAVKFTQKGQIRISVHNAGTDSPTQMGQATGDMCRLEVCVTDTGIGIPRDKLGHILEPFAQADSSIARQFGGTGLGLAIAKRLVEAMGGSISIDSEVGVGTTVRFDFLAETATPKLRPDARETASLWGKRALLVLRPRRQLEFLRLHLKRWGVAHELCENPSQALKLLADESFDIVICETHLPDTDGLEFARSARDEGFSMSMLMLSETRLAKALDPELDVTVLPWSSQESMLYQGLVAVLRASESEQGSEEESRVRQFDGSLAQRIPLRILLAEDNEINCKVALRMLASFGYEADVAQNGAQAIEAVRQRSYDLVLMDIQMPEVDGIQATKFIAKNVPAAKRPRIVALSANVMREDIDAALAAGADGYISKPFTASELRSALEQCAELRAARSRRSSVRGQRPPLLAHERLSAHLDHDDGEFLKGLVRSFVTASRQTMDSMRTAASAGEISGVSAQAHDLAGMSAVLGAERLSHIGLQLQKIARQGTLEGISSLLDTCQAELDNTIAALQVFVDGESAKQDRGGADRSDKVVTKLADRRSRR